MSNPLECKHGRLARKCEICELEAENEQLKAELDGEKLMSHTLRHHLMSKTAEWEALKADLRELVQVLETVIQNPFREGTFSSDRVITLAKAVLNKHKETK